MNSKKANRLFLSVVLMHFVLIFILIVGSQFFSLGLVSNLLVSQLIILLPACVSLFFNKKRISTVLLTIIYTLLCMPLVTVVNAISMLFVENTVVAISSDILALPFPVSLFQYCSNE